MFKPTFERQQAWQLLYDLASRTRASFEAAKYVRSARLGVDQFYALVRLSNCLEQPSRGHVRRLLQQACKFRKLIWPKARAVLQLPFLAHDEFAKEVLVPPSADSPGQEVSQPEESPIGAGTGLYDGLPPPQH